MIRSLFIFCLSFSLVAVAKPTTLKRKPADFYAANAAILNSSIKNSVKANIYFGHYSEADRQRALADMNRWMKPPQFRATRNAIMIFVPEQTPVEIQFKRLSPEKSEVIINGKSVTFKRSDGYRAHIAQIESLLRASNSAGLKNLLFPRAEAFLPWFVWVAAATIGAWAGADALLKCDSSQAQLIYKECLVRETLDFHEEAADTVGSIAKSLAPEQVEWLERQYRSANYKANEQIQRARTYILGEDEVTLEAETAALGGAGSVKGTEQTN